MTETTIETTETTTAEESAEAPRLETKRGDSNPPETPETAPEQPENSPESDVEPDSTQPGLDALQAENDALRAEVQRLRVAAAKGVPPELLTATDEDGLQAQAAALLAFAASRSGVPDFGAGNRGTVNVAVVDPIRTALGR